MPEGLTIAAGLAGTPVALDPLRGLDCLNRAWPDDAMALPDAQAPVWAAAGGEIQIERGQRYAVVRGIGILPVRGLLTPNVEVFERYLGWATYAGLTVAAGELAAQEDVQAVIAVYDSPGGMVLGLEGAATALAELGRAKPLYSLVSPLAASAAYWLAVTGQEIVMTPGAVVGSIGVMRGSSAPVAPDILGNRQRVHLSSHARAKLPDPETEAGQREIQRELDALEARFHAAVAAGRGIPEGELAARLSVTDDPRDGGAVFSGDEAMERGLVDGVASERDYLARIFAAHAPRPAAAGRRATMGRGAQARARAAAALARV
jgi:ClpP class serine protease